MIEEPPPSPNETESEVPSPQSTTAVKLPWLTLALESESVKVATVPLKDWPSTAVTGWPVAWMGLTVCTADRSTLLASYWGEKPTPEICELTVSNVPLSDPPLAT